MNVGFEFGTKWLATSTARYYHLTNTHLLPFANFNRKGQMSLKWENSQASLNILNTQTSPNLPDYYGHYTDQNEFLCEIRENQLPISTNTLPRTYAFILFAGPFQKVCQISRSRHVTLGFASRYSNFPPLQMIVWICERKDEAWQNRYTTVVAQIFQHNNTTHGCQLPH